MDKYFNIFLLTMLQMHCFFGVQATTVNNETITLISELQKIISPQIPVHSVINNISKDELYWINWLKANDFDLHKTRVQLLEHLHWRQMHKIDSIHMEDWSLFESEYPAYTDTVDKMGRPIVELWLSEWNFRKAVIAGHSQRLLRWSTKIMEMELRKLFELRGNGKRNVTGAIEIIDFSGLNMIQNGCPMCISVYRTMGATLERHYPGLIQTIYVVNVSSTFRYFLQLWRQNTQYASGKMIQGYSDRREWMDILNRKIDKDQRSVRFGGIKARQE